MRKSKNNRKLNFEISKGIALLTQLSISFLLPVFLGIWATRSLAKRWQLGEGFVIFGIMVGIVIGASSVYSLISKSYHLDGRPSEKKTRHSIFEVDEFLRNEQLKEKKEDGKQKWQ